MGAPEVRRVGRGPVAVFAVVVGVLGAWLGGLLLARTEVPMGPFRVEVAAGFGRGVTDLGLPPFGRIIADTHVAPLRVSASLTDVGVEELTRIVREEGTRGLTSAVERDALAQLRTLALRLLVTSLLGAAVLSALVFRANWRAILISLLSALVVVGGSLVLAWGTYRPAAFTEPTYTGSLAAAAKLIGPVREATDRIEDFRTGLEALVASATRAYTSIQAQPLSGDDTIRVLHISDIHASPLGMDFAQGIAQAFDVDLVLDTGDLTSFGLPLEDLITSEIPSFGRPYVFIRGNHDSMALQATVSGVRNAVVLDGDTAEVSGLSIYGLGHPKYTPSGREAIDPYAFEEEARAVAPRIAEDLAPLDQPPAIVAVHDDRMVESLAGRFPLVVSGHFHETRARVVNGTLLLRIGTTGGNGAGIFRGLDIPFSAEILYLSREPAGGLVAYDVIEQWPDTGSLIVTRHLVSEVFGELVLTPTPSVTPSATSSTPTATPIPSG